MRSKLVPCSNRYVLLQVHMRYFYVLCYCHFTFTVDLNQDLHLSYFRDNGGFSQNILFTVQSKDKIKFIENIFANYSHILENVALFVVMLLIFLPDIDWNKTEITIFH